MAKEEEDKKLFVRCPKCGRILDACEHVSKEDIATIKRLLDAGIVVYEDEEDMLEDEMLSDQAGSDEHRIDLYQLAKPRFTLDHVVLSGRTRRALEDALIELENKRTMFESWGLSKVARKKKGLSMLFAGPPGTGKTMTAEAIAKAMNKRLMIVNYAQLENMWVGETEKNIERVFKEAEKRDAVLFFDEADAVFYRRGLTSTPWANRDVNVLLSRLENFDGVVILATNMARILDQALDRRIDIAVEFDFPDVKMRKEIFEKTVPKKAPLAENVDFEGLSRKYPLSGGNILNVVRQAMRNALRRGGKRRKITMEDFVKAAEQELEKSKVMKKNHLYSVDASKTRQDVRYYA